MPCITPAWRSLVFRWTIVMRYSCSIPWHCVLCLLRYNWWNNSLTESAVWLCLLFLALLSSKKIFHKSFPETEQVSQSIAKNSWITQNWYHWKVFIEYSSNSILKIEYFNLTIILWSRGEWWRNIHRHTKHGGAYSKSYYSRRFN